MVGMLLGKQNPRLQLSGCANARRLDTGIVALSGKFPLDAAARRDTPAAVFKGPTLVMGRGGCFLFASALEYSPDALRTYDRDEYVMWGFSARRDLLAPHLDVARLFAFFLDRSESSSGINLRLRAQPPRKYSRHNF
jgi:hypothetical protein